MDLARWEAFIAKERVLEWAYRKQGLKHLFAANAACLSLIAMSYFAGTADRSENTQADDIVAVPAGIYLLFGVMYAW